MKILIVSGFLGAGKTTFIKELIRRSGIQPVVLENEYGDNTLDAQELRGMEQSSQKLEILEFMEGCVCCTMKDSFVNSVLTVFSALDPEYLIVEPTGVGRLSNILSNLQPILHDNISLLKPVVVLAPRSYRQNMNQWPELYEDQVAHAQTVIFSKGEQEDSAMLSRTAEEVRSINPVAEIIQDHYTGQSDAWWRSLVELPAETISVEDSKKSGEQFAQLSLDDARLDNPAQLVLLLEDCLHGVMGEVVRAKGTLPVGGEFLRFDLADGLYAVSGSPQETNQCVFIGRDLRRVDICRRMGSSLAKKIVYQGRLPSFYQDGEGLPD